MPEGGDRYLYYLGTLNFNYKCTPKFKILF